MNKISTLLLLTLSLPLVVGCSHEKEYNNVKSRDELTGTRWIQKLDNHTLCSVFITFYVNERCHVSLYDGDLILTLQYIYKHPNITITNLTSNNVYAFGHVKDKVIYLHMVNQNVDLELKPWSMPN